MLNKKFELIDKEDIERLVERKEPEGKFLEYKTELPGQSVKDRKEFLADVSAFANSAGGHIVFGMEEYKGVPRNIPGLSLTDPDAEIRRMEDILRYGVSPRIPGIQIKAIPGFHKGPVILMRIPRSWAGPHMITFKSWSRFYVRTSAGKHPMDVDELRSAFLLTGNLPERIRQFRDHRLGKIMADETPVPLLGRARVVLHLVPVSSFGQPTYLSVEDIAEQRSRILPLGQGASYTRFNLDGLLAVAEASSKGGKRSEAYCQVFRTGAIESVNAWMLMPRSGEKFVPSLRLEEDVIDSVKSYSSALELLGVARPYVVMLSLIGVHGYRLATGEYRSRSKTLSFDRDNLILPDVLLDEGDVSVEEILRPMFDALWNASGYARCSHYTPDGKWNPHQLK